MTSRPLSRSAERRSDAAPPSNLRLVRSSAPYGPHPAARARPAATRTSLPFLPLLTAALLLLLLAALILPLIFPARAATAAEGRRLPAPAAAARVTPVRDARTLPALTRSARGVPTLDGGTVTPTDTFLSVSNGFQELNGDCAPRGWMGEDLTTRIFAHVSDQFVVNRPFLGGRPAPTLDVATAPITGTALGQASELALNDSGRVVFFDIGCLPPCDRKVYEVYPQANLLRRFAADPVARPRTMASDPSTGGIFIGDAASSMVLYRAPGGGDFTVFADHQASIGSDQDTTLANAEVSPLGMSVDNAGNIYYADAFSGRLRMIRRNDLRVVTLLSGAFAYQVAVNPDGTELFYTATLDSSIHRVDLATLIQTTLTGPADRPIVGTFGKLAWSNGTIYLSAYGPFNFVRPGSIYRLGGGALTRVAGAVSFYGPAASRLSALQAPLADIGGMCADGSGGVYFTSGQTVLRLKTDGDLEHIAGDLLGVEMGARALRVGADMTTAPDEVANWLSPSGYGNGWSQRVVSPPVDLASHPNAVLTFDLASELGITTTLETMEYAYGPATAEGVVVQALLADGRWVTLNNRIVMPMIASSLFGAFTLPIGTFHVEVRLGEDANEFLTHATPARLRIVVQSNTSQSHEDFLLAGGGGAAILDNLALRDGATDLIPFENFEDGTLGGGWTLAALNGAYTEQQVYIHFVRDVPPPATLVQLQPDFDFADPSCAWTFTSANDSVPNGLHARVTSPWIALSSPGSQKLIAFSGKLNTLEQARVLNLRLRGKNVGETRPSVVYFPSFLLNSGVSGGDLSSPFLTERVMRFPDDFFSSGDGESFVCDSIQIVLGVEDRHEELLAPGHSPSATRLPYLDDIHVYEMFVDSDYDGVPNLADTCPAASGAGQDVNGDGCTDPTATFHKIESWPAGTTIRYAYGTGSNAAVPGANAALDSAFAAWSQVAGANLSLQKLLPTDVTHATPFDGLNILSFEDETFPFAPEVLAVTTTLELTRRTAYGDRVFPPGTILDKDILFNPDASFGTSAHPGAFDLRSVATHEIGHLLGLDHSGVQDATMYFVQLPGAEGASLDADDRGALAAGYPAPALTTDFATLRGTVLRDTLGAPVGGALVTAVLLSDSSAALDTLASDFTDEAGRFALFRLPTGRYGVHIQSLDGTVLNGLHPAVVSGRLAAVTGIPFQAEWLSAGESAYDDPAERSAFDLSAGQELAGLLVVTNLDTIPPGVQTVNPPASSSGIGIDASVQVTFTDPIATGTLNASFGVYPALTPNTRLTGIALVADRGRRLVFTPDNPLDFTSEYIIRITTALTDEAGVPLGADFASTFLTQDRPPVSISNIQPRVVSPGALITITGTGFNPAPLAINKAVFEQPALPSAVFIDSVLASYVTPTSMVVRVPFTEEPGIDSVHVVVDDESQRSNLFAITILPPAEQPSPSVSGSPVPLGFAPTDVALAPDGSMAYVVGDGGFVTVNLSAPSGEPLRIAVPRDPRAAVAVALNPDGSRAFVTYAEDSAVVVYDAAPFSATLGSVVAEIPLVGRPGPIAVAPTGARAYAGDAAHGIIHEIDVRATGPTAYTQLAATPFPPGIPTGLAVSYDNSLVAVGSTGGGYYLRLQDRTTSFQTATFAQMGGVAASPLGGIALYSAGASGVAPADGGLTFTGGVAKDIVYTPQGQAAYVVNSLLNRVQVMNMNATSPGYLSIVTDVGTGSSPVAVAVDAGGALLAIANRGSRDLTLYLVTQSGVPPLSRVANDRAVAGELVSVQGDPSLSRAAPPQVDLGLGTLHPITHWVGTSAGFRVPPLSARETQVVLEWPGPLRTLALPFRVVDPITTFAPASALAIAEEDTLCPAVGGAVGGYLSQLRLSLDGRTLAVVRENPCYLGLDLYSTVTDGSRPFAALLAKGQISATPGDIADGAFTPDGLRFWTVGSTPGIRAVNTDPASPNFSNQTFVFGISEVGAGRAVLRDPLGRWMIVGSPTASRLSFWNWERDSLIATLGAIEPVSLAASGDGRLLVCGESRRASFVNLDTRTVLAQGPLHGPLGALDSMFFSVAVTRDGRRAMGVWGVPNTGVRPWRIAVWNLDSTAGAVGQELYFGIPAGMAGFHPGRLVAGPDAQSIVANATFTNHFLRFDLSATPPVVTVAPAAHGAIASSSLQRSADGRQLWLAEPGNTGEVATDGVIHLYGLDEAANAALVSGDGQSGLANASLPIPVRARVTTPSGAPSSGSLLRFSLEAGNGVLEPVLTTAMTLAADINGEAQVLWRLPANPGAVQLKIEVLGKPAIPQLLVNANVVLDDASVVPEIVSLSPPPGATGLNVQTPVAVRFNQRMEPAVIDRVFLFANDVRVTGRYTLADDGRFVLFQPAEPLPFAARCSLAVLPGALDLDGQAVVSGASVSFTLQSAPTLEIVAIVPPAGPPGAAVAINGDGFAALAAQNTVLFSGTLGTVRTANTTGLTIDVPLVATSGPVTVTAAGQTSAGFNFIVLPPNADPGGIIGDLPAGQGSRDIALTPDGARAYITNPPLNTINVLDLVTVQTLTSVTVGLRPLAVAVLASPLRAYVANNASNSVSVVDADPASPTYHKVVQTIPVDEGPVDIAVWSAGRKVYVLNADARTLNVIDAGQGNATFDQVVATVNCGASATQVVLSNDGTRAYVAMAEGLQVIDLRENAVVATVNCGASATQVVLSNDGTLAYVLTSAGQLVVVSLSGPSANQVVGTVNCGASATQVVLSTDGSLAYVSSADGTVLVFQIGGGAGGNASTTLPSSPITLTLIETFVLGGAPAGIAPDPLGRARVWVANEGTGRVHVLGTSNALPRVTVDFDFTPNTINARSMGRWVKGTIEPPAPFLAESLIVSTIRLNGVVPADAADAPDLGDRDHDGITDLRVRFSRQEVHLLLPAGNAVPVCVEGRLGSRDFIGCDTIRVKHGKVFTPKAGDVIPPLDKYRVTWRVDEDDEVKWVSLLWTLDHGATWQLISEKEDNDGEYWWDVPAVIADSVRIALVFVEKEDVPQEAVDPEYSEEDDVVGVFAMSEPFDIFGTTDVLPAPAELAFALTGANPARGAARMAFGLPKRTEVRLDLFDVAGRRVRTLARGVHEAGWHDVSWNGTGEHGAPVGAGIYFARFRADGREIGHRLIWLR